jgi:hypothetical protein
VQTEAAGAPLQLPHHDQWQLADPDSFRSTTNRLPEVVRSPEQYCMNTESFEKFLLLAKI